MGPKETKILVLPFSVVGDGIQGVLPVLQVRNLLASVALSNEGTVRVQVYNSADEAKLLSPKLKAAAIIKTRGSRFNINKPEASHEEKGGPSRDLVSASTTTHAEKADLNHWVQKYPVVFSQRMFSVGKPITRLKICHKEIEWLRDVADIPSCSRGVRYVTGDVSSKEADEVLADMEARGVIRRVRPGERVFLSPTIWVRKPNGKARKTLDFRLLNTYCRTWRTPMASVKETVSSIPPEWDRFTVLDLDCGFFHLQVCDALQKLFGFEHQGRRRTYKCLPMGWSCSPSLFLSRLRSIFEATKAVIYQDDILIGGSNQEEHDENLEEVLKVMEVHCLHTNRQKIQLCEKEVIFLGYDVRKSTFSLDSYISKQCAQVPISTSKHQLQKIIGILNVCRPTCHRLSQWLEPLQKELSLPRKDRSDLATLQEKTRKVWELVLRNSMSLHRLPTNATKESHLYVDWSGVGTGYALFSGPMSEGLLIGINSRRETNSAVSSMLGELRGLCWALEQVKATTAGTRLVVWTDSQSAYQCVMGTPRSGSLLDTRISRLLDWLWMNFAIPSRLEVRYLPGASNGVANVLSRWPSLEKAATTFLTE